MPGGDHCLLLEDHDGATAEIITGLFWERLTGGVEAKAPNKYDNERVQTCAVQNADIS